MTVNLIFAIYKKIYVIGFYYILNFIYLYQRKYQFKFILKIN